MDRLHPALLGRQFLHRRNQLSRKKTDRSQPGNGIQIYPGETTGNLTCDRRWNEQKPRVTIGNKN